MLQNTPKMLLGGDSFPRLDRRIDNMDDMKAEVAAWEQDRNYRSKKISWQFTTSEARIKLTRLYPKL